MKMTVQDYLQLAPQEAAKIENITALLQDDRALYDLELAGKKKLSPVFLEKAMPAIVKLRDFQGSYQKYEKGLLNKLSNFHIFYERVHEYSVQPKKEKTVIPTTQEEKKKTLRM